MPLNTRVFNLVNDVEGIGAGAELVDRFEKLRRELRRFANVQQLRRAYAGEPSNFGLKLGGMERLQDLKALGEFLGIDDPFETEDAARRGELVLQFQSQEEVKVRIDEVGVPSATQALISSFIADSIVEIEGSVGGFSVPGVTRSLDLFIRNYLSENQFFSADEIANDPNFQEAATNFVALVEAREAVAESTRILNLAADGDFDELETFAAQVGVDIGEAGQLLQQGIEDNRRFSNQVIAANPDSLITRSYKQSIDSKWLSGVSQDVNDVAFSLIPDDEWNLFLQNEDFTPAVRDYFETNRSFVETQFSDRPDKGLSFLLWSGTEFAPQANDIVDRFSVVNFGFRPDPVLDPLLSNFLGDLPVALRAPAMDRFKEFIATIQQGPGQDKSQLWQEFVNGVHGETPDGVLDRYIGDLITGRPGGAEFVEAARASGLSLTSLAATTGDPVEWLKSITDNGTAQGLPPVEVVPAEELNLRAWVIEQYAQDTDLQNSPAVVRDAVYSTAVSQLTSKGFDPITSENALDYTRALSGDIGVSNVKVNVLESIVRNSGPNGDQLWEDLKRQQAATGFSFPETGVVAPDTIFSIFNDIEGLDKDTLLIDNLRAQLVEAAEELGPTPEEAALAGFAEKTRNLPSAIQGTANRRIEQFLASFLGEDREEVLARQDVQDRIALIVEGVGQEFIGADEVVELAVGSFGGLNEFFAAFPDLQESDTETIQGFIVDNFDTILESAGPDAETTELNKARQRVLSDRRKRELRDRRQALANEAEERALEFDESDQGRELARLTEAEGIRQEQLAVFTPELERAVRGRIAGPAASQVLADVGPRLQRQFLDRQAATLAAEQAGTPGFQPVSPTSFLEELDEDFFVQERRRSVIRRSPVNVAAPSPVGLGRVQQQGPGFNPFRRGI